MIAGVELSCTAFEGNRRIASGDLTEVAAAVKAEFDGNSSAQILIFDNLTSRAIELDVRGTLEDVLSRVERGKRIAFADRDRDGTATLMDAQSTGPRADDANSPRGPGRPKLGVVAREVTLLPRHWSWLNSQPGGASVALRKLVEDARRTHATQDRTRIAQESAYRFILAMAGDEAGFESASRALFAGEGSSFEQSSASWPPDVRDHARMLAAQSFATSKLE